MPTAAVDPTLRRAFVLDSFRVQGARTPHGNPQTIKELAQYCEEVVCEGLYSEVMDAVARQDAGLAGIAGVSDMYLLWAVDMTMYYFVISSLKARGVVNSLDATAYFTFRYPKPDKWVMAEHAATSSTAAFGGWMAGREGQGSNVQLEGNVVTTIEGGPVQASTLAREGINIMSEKLATRPITQDDMDDLVDFMNQVVL